MDICVNDEVIAFDGSTVADLVQYLKLEAPFAVAVNTSFVARNQYSTYYLQSQDKVDIVSPVVGG
ncbi:sulfur carrier protein ThiS [Snodgrassella alvi]|jgi:sulfur carrier protein|uniref:Thiamine biosynthesis protein ThiS n=1 Tax=Snodgrassella alvi TaxID=1196083 RepID=A0A855G513_9NEIS|nr:sulfur carrier protein ThiS [Snodgrassella alvi]PIT13150.1 thiamine biosynthesis protein ThiS [Snodgrassella alvi]PIT24236.1 thiamine biosynthesis protein ThiS [Snodgrassella alvi]PIT47225.1 thiamine biosynthesis protein ThiS [Snodgrassella alvi]PIT55833.1 thiamine biosynthesis protein ThiS [Snodgrassella alvi]PIT58847.1 thiamine biosynthesis protein ThiS [Snodgrassella alvi]